MLFRYESADRAPDEVTAGIRALRVAHELGLPIFALTRAGSGNSQFAAHLSWIEGVSDLAGCMFISFREPNDVPGPIDPAEAEDAPFFLTASPEDRATLRNLGIGRQRFVFEVLRRYGPRCAFCSINLPRLLDAVHICGVGQRGSNDPRNGLPLCALHHRAYECHYVAIEPATLRVVPAPSGPSLKELHVTHKTIGHLANVPHPAALEFAWSQFA
jgi:hypothetical protein